MFGLRDLAASFRENERHFLIFGLDAILMLEFHNMAFDDVAVAADDFDELPGHLVLPSSPNAD
jgi:hypothetical protein